MHKIKTVHKNKFEEENRMEKAKTISQNQK